MTAQASRLKTWRWVVPALGVAALAGAVVWNRIEPDGTRWSSIEAEIANQRWKEAETGLRSWLRRHPGDARAWYSLGGVLEAEGRHEESADAFRRVPESHELWPSAQTQLGEIAFARRDVAAAEQAFRNAADRQPGAVDPRRRLVYLYSILQRNDEARVVLWELYRLTRDPRQLVTIVGVQSTDPARQTQMPEVESFVRQTPDDPWIRRAWGLLLLKAGRTAEARPYLESAVARIGNDPLGRFALVDCTLALGDINASEVALGAKPDRSVHLARWWLLKGEILEARGRTAEALDCWRRAVDADRDNRMAQYRLGQALVRLGRSEEATPHLDRAERIRNREVVLTNTLDRLIRGGVDAGLYEQLGAICAELGLVAEARAWYEEAIRLDPTRSGAQTALTRLIVPPAPPLETPRLRSTAPGSAVVPTRAVTSPSGASGVRFEDVARRAGIDFQYYCGENGDLFIGDTMGGGVAMIDFDRDGWLDLYFVNGCPLPVDRRSPASPNRLYRNKRDGTFEDVTKRAGVGGRGYGMGCTVADYDEDGHDDLFVTGLGDTVLYRNRGDGTFEDVTDRAGVRSSRWSTAAGFADLDADGDLDLVVVTYVEADPLKSPECLDPSGKRMHCPPGNFPAEPDHLFRNNGDGTFTDVAREAGLDVPNGVGLGLAIADFDGDGKLDLFVANDAVPNFLFRNKGNLKFEEVGAAAGVAYDGSGRATASMGVVADDLDEDGRIDLFHTNFLNEPNTFARNLGGGLFIDATAQAGLDGPSRPVTGFGTTALDADNDGHLDLFVANGHVDDRPWVNHPMAQLPHFYRAASAGKYQLAAGVAPYFERPAVGRGAAAGDLDNDGRVDLVVVHRDQPVAVLRNESRGGHWLGVRLRGGGKNPWPVGARVTCRAGEHTSVRWLTTGTSYLAANDPRLWFGLGRARSVDRLEVRWPSGQVQTWNDLPADQIVEVAEGAEIGPGRGKHAASRTDQ